MMLTMTQSHALLLHNPLQPAPILGWLAASSLQYYWFRSHGSCSCCPTLFCCLKPSIDHASSRSSGQRGSLLLLLLLLLGQPPLNILNEPHGGVVQSAAGALVVDPRVPGVTAASIVPVEK
jgi:hypothetical protein